MTEFRFGVNVLVCLLVISTQLASFDAFEDQPGCNLREWFHYVIVRGDLSPGLKVAQVVHAAGESTPQRVPTGTTAVALSARDQEHLLQIRELLDKACIPHVLISESNGEAMAIGIEPTTDRAKLRKVTSSLPLVK